MKSELTILLLSASTALMVQQAGAQENDVVRRGNNGYQVPPCEDMLGQYKNTLGETFICDQERADHVLSTSPYNEEYEYQGNGIFCGPIYSARNGQKMYTHFMVSSKHDFSMGFGFIGPRDEVTDFVQEQDRTFHLKAKEFLQMAPTKQCGKAPPMS